MSKFIYKEQVQDLITDSADIVRMMGRSLENGHLDTNSALHNLSAALNKLEKAADLVRK